MAIRAVEEKQITVRLACKAFKISQYCYRYEPKLNEENEIIADWLIRLTHNQKNWGFGLCFLYLRNVKGYKWNHKRVYRIYKELELNLRIKPKKRIKREAPEPLSVPVAPNEVWSMDFMHDNLNDGRNFRLFNVKLFCHCFKRVKVRLWVANSFFVSFWPVLKNSFTHA